MNIVLYTRQNCPLCEKAKDVLRAEGVTPKEVDIDLDLDLLRRFNDDVPVIYVEGEEAFRHRVEPEHLRVVLAGWRVVDRHHLEKEFRFPDFARALAFTNEAGRVAEELNHHPDILLGWGRAKVMTWSHDAGAITERDWKLAAAIEQLYKPAVA
jgi:4a-hydroxytetrahydrobiopterin dehydratase